MIRISTTIVHFLLFFMLKRLVQGGPPGLSGYGCSANCTMTKTSGWIKNFNYDQPIGTEVTVSSAVTIANRELNFINKSCTLLDEFSECVNKCPSSGFRNIIVKKLAEMQNLCKSNDSDKQEAEMCLNTYGRSIQAMCKVSYENFLAAGVRLQNITHLKKPEDFLTSIQDLCNGTIIYAQCLVPALSQKCNRTVLDMFDHVFQVASGTVQGLLGPVAKNLPVCNKLLNSKILKGETGVMTFGQQYGNDTTEEMTSSVATTTHSLIEIHAVQMTAAPMFKNDHIEGRKIGALGISDSHTGGKTSGSACLSLACTYVLMLISTAMFYV